ncbi:hypothetical protein PFISCL1PPCAC_4350, partial [Pristionchus fissidentatus]
LPFDRSASAPTVHRLSPAATTVQTMEIDKLLRIVLIATIVQIPVGIFLLSMGGMVLAETGGITYVLLLGIHSIVGIVIGFCAVFIKNRCLLIVLHVNACLDICSKGYIACKFAFAAAQGRKSDEGAELIWAVVTALIIAVICDFVAYYPAYKALRIRRAEMSREACPPQQAYGTPGYGNLYGAGTGYGGYHASAPTVDPTAT